MRSSGLLIVAFLLTLSLPANALIEKRALVCKNSVCFKWWPMMPPMSGWHQDEEASEYYNLNMFVHDFLPTSDVMMYANAVYKARAPENKSIADVIRHDKENFSKRITSEVQTLSTKDGQNLASYTFFPANGSTERWEQIAYGEGHDEDKNEYFLLFVLSARTKDIFDKHHDDYVKFVGSYTDIPLPKKKSER